MLIDPRWELRSNGDPAIQDMRDEAGFGSPSVTQFEVSTHLLDRLRP